MLEENPLIKSRTIIIAIYKISSQYENWFSQWFFFFF